MASQFCEVAIFIGPNAFRIKIASACEPIRLPSRLTYVQNRMLTATACPISRFVLTLLVIRIVRSMINRCALTASATATDVDGWRENTMRTEERRLQVIIIIIIIIIIILIPT